MKGESEVQKNFKKQMNQSLKELKKKDKEAYHEYIKRNHLDDAKSRIAEETRQKVVSVLTAPFKILLNTIGLVVIIVFGYNFVKMINNQIQSHSVNTIIPVMYERNQISTTKQKEIIDYMNFINPIIISINEDINLRNKDLENINRKLLTNSEYINNSTVYINRITNNKNEIVSASCPNVLQLYKIILLNQYSSLIKAMNNEIKYLNSGNELIKNEVTKNIEEYRYKNQEAQNELNNILKENKLK